MGSPGGLAIPSYVLKTLVGMFDWNLSVQGAIDLPNLVSLGDFYATEPAKLAPGVVEGLAAKGVRVQAATPAKARACMASFSRTGTWKAGPIRAVRVSPNPAASRSSPLREANLERRALGAGRHQRELAAVALGQLTGDGETQARAALTRGAGKGLE